MNRENQEGQSPPDRAHESEMGFISKVNGAFSLSGESFSKSYRSSKLWQGYLVFFICIGLLSLIISTTSIPLFNEYFPYYSFSVSFLELNISIIFSPQLLVLSFLFLINFWLLLSITIVFFKRLKLKRVASTLGFSFIPLLILILYPFQITLWNYQFQLPPILLVIGIGWCILSGLSAFTNLIGFKLSKFGGLINHSIKSINHKKNHAFIAIFGITVAVGLIIIPSPIINGYHSQLNAISQENQFSEYLIALELDEPNYYSSFIDSTILPSLNHPNIQEISPETYLNVNLTLKTITSPINMRGINFSIFRNFRNSFNFQILPGKNFSDDQLLIGSLLATLQNITYAELPINITLTYDTEIRNVTIIGFITSNIYLDYELLAPINLTWNLKPELSNKFSLIEMKVDNLALIDSTIQTLRAENPDIEVYRENRYSDVITGSISSIVLSFWLLSIVIYIIIAFGMFYIMQTIVHESKRKIAELKSIGFNRSQITRIYLYQTILFCLIGSILGVVLGIYLSFTASIIASSIAALVIPPIFDMLIIAISILLGITAGIIGGLYPVYSAFKMTPLGE